MMTGWPSDVYLGRPSIVCLTRFDGYTGRDPRKVAFELINAATKNNSTASRTPKMFLTVNIECADSGDDGERSTDVPVITTRLDVALKQLEFTHHRSVLHLLEHCPRRPAGTTVLGLVQQVMEQHGWRRKRAYRKSGNAGGGDSVMAVTQAPHIRDYRLYNLIAIDARALERVIAMGAPTFDIERCIKAYCKQYGVRRGKTFPSLRHDIANHAAAMDKQSGAARASLTRARKKLLHEQRRHDIGSDITGFIYDNDDLQQSDEETEDEACVEPKKRGARRRVDDADIEWTRLIPVAILPLFMMHLPLCFTRVNEAMHACEALESRLWQRFTGMTQYESHVGEQVRAMAVNRRYMSFVHQRHYVEPIDNGSTRRLPLKTKGDSSDALQNALREIERLKKQLSCAATTSTAAAEIENWLEGDDLL